MTDPIRITIDGLAMGVQVVCTTLHAEPMFLAHASVTGLLARELGDLGFDHHVDEVGPIRRQTSLEGAL
jgi:hypothetical protein